MQAKPPSGEFLQIPVKIPAFSVLKFFEIVILQEINRHHSALSTGCKRRGHHEARPLGRGQAPCLFARRLRRRGVYHAQDAELITMMEICCVMIGC
ncbi:MAG: hypothetical protein Q9P14_00300 [candidate division KSB1 bacterium]|nr:hypothetical protein [candidate division KSB1 bacterium]